LTPSSAVDRDPGEIVAVEAPESQDFSPPLNRMVLSILALLGLSVALYMWAYAAGLTGPVLCSVGDCEAVQNSEFSRIAGIPVAAFGVLGYLAMLAVALLGLQPGLQHTRLIPALLLVGGVVGVAFSAYLTYLEASVIHAWCQWCVSSAIIMVLAFLVSLPELRRMRGDS
jgi:uncharacterized membrane protein